MAQGLSHLFIYCCCRGLELIYQHLQGGSQLYITPPSGDPHPQLDTVFWLTSIDTRHTLGTHAHIQTKCTLKNTSKNLKNNIFWHFYLAHILATSLVIHLLSFKNKIKINREAKMTYQSNKKPTIQKNIKMGVFFVGQLLLGMNLVLKCRWCVQWHFIEQNWFPLSQQTHCKYLLTYVSMGLCVCFPFFV